MNFADVPWTYFLPALVMVAFGVGLVYKRLQDRTVQYVRHTLRPGQLHIDDLEQYARNLGKQA